MPVFSDCVVVAGVVGFFSLRFLERQFVMIGSCVKIKLMVMMMMMMTTITMTMTMTIMKMMTMTMMGITTVRSYINRKNCHRIILWS